MKKDLFHRNNFHEFLEPPKDLNNSFVWNINILAKHIKELIQLNEKLTPDILDALEGILEQLDDLGRLIDDLDKLEDLWSNLDCLLRLCDALDELEKLIDDALKAINDALQEWRDIEENILPKLEELTGIFTGVQPFQIDVDTQINPGDLFRIPNYSYKYATIQIHLSGMKTVEFETVAPVDSTQRYSEYIRFKEIIPVGTQILGMIFTSPDTVVVPDMVIHDSSLVGDGVSLSPLGVNPTLLTQLTNVSNQLVIVQNDISTINADIATLQANDVTQSIQISDLQTNKADTTYVDGKLSTLPDWVSDVTITTTDITGTLEIDTLSSNNTSGSMSHVIPMANSVVAGLMSSTSYKQVYDIQNIVNGLLGTSYVVLDTTITTTSTQSDLNTIWTNSGNNFNEGIMIENWPDGIRYIFRNTVWNGPYTIPAPVMANDTQTGFVKGTPDATGYEGKVHVLSDGSMVLIGYSDLATDISNLSSGLTSLDTNTTSSFAISNTAITTLQSQVSSLTARVATLESNKDVNKVWTTIQTIVPPYNAGTIINVPSYTMGIDSLEVFRDGVRTTKYTEESNTSISLTEGLMGTENMELIVDCFNH